MRPQVERLLAPVTLVLPPNAPSKSEGRPVCNALPALLAPASRIDGGYRFSTQIFIPHGSAAAGCAWEAGRSPGLDREFPPEAPPEGPGSGELAQAWAAEVWADQTETAACRGLRREGSRGAG
jgi:hypothetical protein